MKIKRKDYEKLCAINETLKGKVDFYDCFVRYLISTNINFEKETAPNDINIKEVRFSGRCTLIYWEDGTMTKALCHKDDTNDPYIGFMVAYLKKICNFNKFSKMVKKYVSPGS